MVFIFFLDSNPHPSSFPHFSIYYTSLRALLLNLARDDIAGVSVTELELSVCPRVSVQILTLHHIPKAP
jgi:hypothetical protein